MPTVKLPADSSVTPDRVADLFSSHTYSYYLALGTLLLLLTLRSFVSTRFCFARAAGIRDTKCPVQGQVQGQGKVQVRQGDFRKDSWALYEKRDSVTHASGPAPASSAPAGCCHSGPRALSRVRASALGEHGDHDGQHGHDYLGQQVIWAAGLLPPAPSGVFVPVGEPVPGMEGKGKQRRDWDSQGSGSTTSRAVSTQHSPSSSGSDRKKSSRYPKSSHGESSSSKRHSGGSDADDGKKSKGKGKATAYTPTSASSSARNSKGKGKVSGAADETAWDGEQAAPWTQEPTFRDGAAELDDVASMRFSRPPPPPPLTAPIVSSSVFAFEDRRVSFAASIPPALDTGYAHRAVSGHGDDDDDYAYMSSTDLPSSSPMSATTRHTYNKKVSVGIPIPHSSASSSQETMTSADTFSPSSYPPTSPLLPPPPPGYEFAYDTYDYVWGGPEDAEGDDGEDVGHHGEMDLQGEVISAMDDAGHGWKRHTRVYGGGVCLACVASGGEGGFYGDNVPPEQRR